MARERHLIIISKEDISKYQKRISAMTMVVRFWYLQIIERFWKVQADNPCSAMSKVWDGDILIMLWLLISCIYDNHESSTLRARWWWWCRRGFRLIWPLLRVRMDNFDHSFLQNTIFVFTRTNRTIGLFLDKTSNTTKWIQVDSVTKLVFLFFPASLMMEMMMMDTAMC